MSELFDARAKSHETRKEVGHRVYITNDGASYTPPPPPPSFKYQLSRGIVSGLQGAGQGIIDVRNEISNILAPYAEAIPTEARDAIITSLMGFTTPRADDSVQEVPSLPEVDTTDAGMAESLLSGLVQFGAGAAAAPIKGAGMVAQMGRGAFSDALFNPEDGNFSTMLKQFGLDNAVLDFLDSQVDGDAGADERLQARLKQSLEGAGLGALVDGAMAGFRAIRSDEGLVETVRQSLAETGAQAKAAFDAIPVDSNTMYSNPMVAAVDAARTAYEASPNDATLRKNYLELRRQRDADPVAQVELPTATKPGIIAFHGSGADFNKFNIEEIGTGEGAQAYGYGLYFADQEDIAKYYRDFLSKSIDVDGKPFIRGNKHFDDALGGDQDLADNLGATQGDLEQAIKEAKETRQEMLDFGNEEAADIYADELYKLEQLRGRVTDNSTKGHMYKVGLVPKPDEMLDYYKPLSEQPDNIQAAYKKAYHNKFIKGDADLEVLFANPNDLTMQDMGIFDKSTGAQAYRELADKLGSIDWPVGADAKTRQEFRTKGEAAASKALFEAGIPGIKFLDNSARKTSGTSSNYVIFDDSMIKILEKYGIVGPVAISAAAASKGGQKDDET